jgi:hypothetical protein
MGLVIRTSELVAMSQALTVRPSLSPTTSFRSGQGSFEDHDAVRSMAQRQKKPEFGSSPGRTGSIPISSSNPRTSSEHFGTSPRPEPMTLAPDEHGNAIPPDAKWTKVTRRLISPEVLDQDRRRYEGYVHPFPLSSTHILITIQPPRFRSNTRSPFPSRNRIPRGPLPRNTRSASPPKPIPTAISIRATTPKTPSPCRSPRPNPHHLPSSTTSQPCLLSLRIII